jgi:transcription initiation factor TFIIB
MPTLAIYDQGLSTKIGKDNRDHNGRTITDPSVRSVLERIRTWDHRTQSHDTKGWSRKYAFDQLDRLRQKLHYLIQLSRRQPIFIEKLSKRRRE